MTQRPFPDERSCTAWEDCQHDGICHDPMSCGAIGPNHAALYGLDDMTPNAPQVRAVSEADEHRRME